MNTDPNACLPLPPSGEGAPEAWSRRAMLGMGGLAAGGAALAGLAWSPESAAQVPARGAAASAFGSVEDLALSPAERLREWTRIYGHLDEDRLAVHWGRLFYYLVRPGVAPTPLVVREGLEIFRCRRVGRDAFEFQGNNASAARDFATGRFTDVVRHPDTGETAPIPRVKLILNDPGYVKTPTGTRPLDGDAERPFETRWTRVGDTVHCLFVRVPPATWPATFLESSSTMCSQADFANRQAPVERAWGSGMSIAPIEWRVPAWKGMGAIVVGHADGWKLHSVDELPPDFLELLQREGRDSLAVDRRRFRNPRA